MRPSIFCEHHSLWDKYSIYLYLFIDTKSKNIMVHLLEFLIKEYIYEENRILSQQICEKNQQIAELMEQVAELQTLYNTTRNQSRILVDNEGNHSIFEFNMETGIYEEVVTIEPQVERRLSFSSDSSESVDYFDMEM